MRLGIASQALRRAGIGPATRAPATGPARRTRRLRRALQIQRSHRVVCAVLRNPMARGLLLDDSLRPAYTRLPSNLAHVFMSLRSSHLPGDLDACYGERACPEQCPLCRCRVYSAAEDFGAAHDIEHRWRHIEHLLLLCPCVTSPDPPGRMAIAILRRDLLEATRDDPAARTVVESAFPSGPPDAAAATACTVPFLLDPVSSLLATPGTLSGSVTACSRLVAAFVLTVAALVGGPASLNLLRDSVPRLRVPPGAGVLAISRPQRSAAQDAVAARSSVIDGVCVCVESALRGAEADARWGEA